VSHFVKQALIDVAPLIRRSRAERPRRLGRLAQRLGVKAIHIAERDTQVSTTPAPGEFVNTWSIDGFGSEGSAGRTRLGNA
jgi:homospermidine synthase